MGYVPNPPPHVGWASTGIHIQSFLDVTNDDTPLHAEALVHFGVGSAAGSFPSRARPPKDEILLVAAGVWSPIRTCSRVRDACGERHGSSPGANSPDLPAALLLSLESSQGTEKPESSEPGRRSPGM